MKSRILVAGLLAACAPGILHADNARFDLAGPKIDISVTRGTATLPIAEVPNLQPGDKLRIKADLPATQANHLLLVVAFLRGTTNQPPDKWFTEIDTWGKKTREGTTVEVPAGAQQAILFVAPETGGDFKTLRSTVQGKPGLFIRADADLNEASFQQQRIERYLAAMKTVDSQDAKVIQDRSTKLASTLALKPDDKCLKEPVEQQVTCLTQSSAPVLMSDGHGQTVAEAFSTGPSSDFINAASATPVAGAGVYSAYVGAVVDLVHLVSTLHTAQYQYIPAISFPEGPTLNLKLNAPPSFHNPKTVIVIGLPAIQEAKLPPLHPDQPDQVACLLEPKLALRLQGAPLVFSTSFAHGLVLHLNRTGGPADLPLKPDAFEGGLIVEKAASNDDEHRPMPKPVAAQFKAAGTKPVADQGGEPKVGTSTDLTITGTVRGFWGFDPFEGPTLTLQQVPGKGWKLVGDTQLLAGQDNHLQLEGAGTACVQHVELRNDKQKDVNVAFKPAKADDGKGDKGKLALDVPLKQVEPGGYFLAIQQFGDKTADKVPLTAYAGDIHFEALKLHAGDDIAVLTGDGLQNVAAVDVGKDHFVPVGDEKGGKVMRLKAPTGVAPADGADATVKLKDGRSMPAKVTVEAARPGLKLLSFKAVATPAEGVLPVTLDGKNEIPLDGKLTFVVQTDKVFPRDQTVEVATGDGAVHTSLSLAANTLVLQDEHTAVATLDPLKAFGKSAFGKLQMRPIAADGTTGAWQPLGKLVRAPSITGIQCGAGTGAPASGVPDASPSCKVEGHELFLASAFAAGKDFARPVQVPTGFAGRRTARARSCGRQHALSEAA